jgi:hypothetical protein
VLKAIVGMALLTLGGAGAAQALPDFPGDPFQRGGPPGGTHHRVPEIDPAGAMSGLTLLLGGLAVARGRIQKKKK